MNPLPTDYRKWLRFLFDLRKRSDAKYSLAFFSRRIGASSAYLKLVLAGRRDLDLAKALRLARILGFTPAEREYLLILVQENQAREPELRRHFRLQRRVLAEALYSYTEESRLLAVFEDPLAWEVYSLAGVNGFRPDPKWIAQKLLNRAASPRAIAIALEKLLQLGAVQRREDGGLAAQNIVIPRRFKPTKAYLAALHRAQQHLAAGIKDSSCFDSLCLILDEDQYTEVRALLEENKRRITQIVKKDGRPKTHIAFFNANLFFASK